MKNFKILLITILCLCSMSLSSKNTEKIQDTANMEELICYFKEKYTIDENTTIKLCVNDKVIDRLQNNQIGALTTSPAKGIYVIYIKDCYRNDMNMIAHELIHIWQIERGYLVIRTIKCGTESYYNEILWKGEKIDTSNLLDGYYKSPWEDEAIQMSPLLIKDFTERI